ncbi:hypothetical protein HDU83_007531 [Entophlyctis luteolus]|nr:hypothetical protein HDU82_001389 [Entophlyctis luteolus]KAJ3339609.1 hypothetical protein HDU83_007531 [Entophlyctis luteolus]KAJ3376919.1 hypothetical protein HDU84_009228 [Entophlyctis sp. JEL0112]
MRQKLWNGLPAMNFALGASALTFQVFVLYPWHIRLDHDFEIMKSQVQHEFQRELDILRATLSTGASVTPPDSKITTR